VKRPKALIDVDGVLRQFTKGALKIVWQVTGRHYDLSEVTQYDFCAALKLTGEETKIIEQAIGSHSRFASSLDVYPGAVEGLRQLRTVADVKIVTSQWNSNETWTHDTENWLYQNFGIPFTKVHHTNEKEDVYGDIFVDDKVENVRAWMSAWPDKTGVFWRTPQNASGPVPTGAHSTSSWSVLIDIVKEMTGSRQLPLELTEASRVQ
jgi:5'(3')-deoxyribonucleotidase